MTLREEVQLLEGGGPAYLEAHPVTARMLIPVLLAAVAVSEAQAKVGGSFGFKRTPANAVAARRRNDAVSTYLRLKREMEAY